MAAGFSTHHLNDAGAVASEADNLRLEALALADRDASAYTAVIEAYAQPGDVDPDGRRLQICTALEEATAVSLQIARVATSAALLGARLAQHGNPTLKGDALVAVLLGTAAARGAATLVEINVRLGRLDGEWLERVEVYLAAIAGLADSDRGPG